MDRLTDRRDILAPEIMRSLQCGVEKEGLPADDAIPLGHYGSSNLARMKTVYRRGLS